MKTYKVTARAAVYRHPNSSLKPKTLIQSKQTFKQLSCM